MSNSVRGFLALVLLVLLVFGLHLVVTGNPVWWQALGSATYGLLLAVSSLVGIIALFWNGLTSEGRIASRFERELNRFKMKHDGTLYVMSQELNGFRVIYLGRRSGKLVEVVIEKPNLVSIRRGSEYLPVAQGPFRKYQLKVAIKLASDELVA